MKKTMKFTATVLITMYVLAFLPKIAHAYLDPGTGSYIIQILIATVAGGTYLLVTSWSKVKDLLSNLLSKLSKRKNGKDK